MIRRNAQVELGLIVRDCPTCNGDGYSEHWNSRSPSDCYKVYCPDCDGAGVKETHWQKFHTSQLSYTQDNRWHWSGEFNGRADAARITVTHVSLTAWSVQLDIERHGELETISQEVVRCIGRQIWPGSDQINIFANALLRAAAEIEAQRSDWE